MLGIYLLHENTDTNDVYYFNGFPVYKKSGDQAYLYCNGINWLIADQIGKTSAFLKNDVASFKPPRTGWESANDQNSFEKTPTLVLESPNYSIGKDNIILCYDMRKINGTRANFTFL